MNKTNKYTKGQRDMGNDNPLRIPPQNRDAELATLGSMIKDCDGSVRSEIISKLKVEDFYGLDTQGVFQAIVAIDSDMASPSMIDLILLEDRIKKAGAMEAVGGVQFLIDCCESATSEVNGRYYARLVLENSQWRKHIARKEAELAEAYKAGDLEAFRELEEKNYLELLLQTNSSTTSKLGEIADGVCRRILNGEQNEADSLLTGFEDLDGVLGGFKPGQLIIIAARPSLGKTSLALNLAEHIAIDCKVPVGFFSLEMSLEENAKRILCGRSGWGFSGLQNSFATDYDRRKLADTFSEIKDSPLIIDEPNGLTPMALLAKARQMSARYGIKAIFVDYLQLMNVPKQKDKRIETGEISHSLKRLARELHVPVIALSQLNRLAEQRQNNMPRLSDLRESGDIEQDADVVLLLHREDYYKTGEAGYRDTNVANVFIAKNRNGPTGKIELIWEGERMRFLTKAGQEVSNVG